jgi:hypothetical protein
MGVFSEGFLREKWSEKAKATIRALGRPGTRTNMPAAVFRRIFCAAPPISDQIHQASPSSYTVRDLRVALKRELLTFPAPPLLIPRHQ